MPTFRLDGLVLLKVNEAKASGTSIFSYVEASWCALLLIDLRWACILSVQFMMWSGGYSLRGFHPKLSVRGDPAVGYVVATIAIEV